MTDWSLERVASSLCALVEVSTKRNLCYENELICMKMNLSAEKENITENYDVVIFQN